MYPPIHVINPNSDANVTQRIADAVQALARDAGVPLQCATLDAAPPGIVCQRDTDLAAPLVAGYVARHNREASAFVIACYSDPGLYAAREASARPVLGIGQAGLSAALALGERIGVIAVSSAGIARHLRTYRQLGLEHRIAGERAIDLSVADSGDRSRALERLQQIAARLRDDDGADVIVLGCAGMATLRADVERAVGLPVVEPCVAAMSLALSRVRESAHECARTTSR